MRVPRRDSSEQSAARFLRLRAEREAWQAARHAVRDDDGLFERARLSADRGTLAVVEEVLRASDRPMSVREILAAAGDRLPTRSSTPYNIVARDLSVDLRRMEGLSRFVRTSPGRYAMRPPVPADQDPGSPTDPGISCHPDDGISEEELRQRREMRAERGHLDAVPAQWRFVEKNVPGAWAAWVSQVGVSSENFSLGITRRPPVVVATRVRCPNDSSCDCRIFEYGTWRMRNRTV